MHCPVCSGVNVFENTLHHSDGEIFVGKTLVKNIVFYDEAHAHECHDCGQVFYLGFRIKDETEIYGNKIMDA